jgi:hypothetical protein
MRRLQPRLFGALDLDDLPVMDDDGHRAKAQSAQRVIDILERFSIALGGRSRRQPVIYNSLSFHGV